MNARKCLKICELLHFVCVSLPFLKGNAYLCNRILYFSYAEKYRFAKHFRPSSTGFPIQKSFTFPRMKKPLPERETAGMCLQ